MDIVKTGQKSASACAEFGVSLHNCPPPNGIQYDFSGQGQPWSTARTSRAQARLPGSREQDSKVAGLDLLSYYLSSSSSSRS